MPTTPAPPPDPKVVLKDAADAVSNHYDADVLLINAQIRRGLDTTLMDMCRKRRRKKNLIYLLVTSGGDPDAAFRIARTFQEHYERVTCFVTGVCKSAGTLVALGANEFVVADAGELGPIDVQMSKPDELVLRQSGLTATAALGALNEQAFEAFSYFLVQLVNRSEGSISTKTATHLASQMVTGLLANVYGHVDPMHVGEAGRALQIAQRYGQMLMAKSGNYSNDSLIALTAGYPSHGFVIDREEIKRLFRDVKMPTVHDLKLAGLLKEIALQPVPTQQKPVVAFLSTQLPKPASAQPVAPAAQPVSAPSPEPTQQPAAQPVHPAQPVDSGGNDQHGSARAGSADTEHHGEPGEDSGGEPRTSVSDHPAESETVLAGTGR